MGMNRELNYSYDGETYRIEIQRGTFSIEALFRQGMAEYDRGEYIPKLINIRIGKTYLAFQALMNALGGTPTEPAEVSLARLMASHGFASLTATFDNDPTEGQKAYRRASKIYPGLRPPA